MHDDGRQPENQRDAVAPSSSEEATQGSGDQIAIGQESAASAVGEAAADAEPAPPVSPDPVETAPVSADGETPEPPIEMPEGDPEPITSIFFLDNSAVSPPDVPQEATQGLDRARWLTHPTQEESAEASELSGELEELTLPSSVTTLEPLAMGATIGPHGEVMIEELTQQRGRVNHYRGALHGDGSSQPIEVLEAPEDHAGIIRMVEVLEQVRYAMLPKLHLTWVSDGRRYLVSNRAEGQTLANALAHGMTPDEVISTVLQLAQVLRRLHSVGWAMVGLAPDGVVLGQPLRITQLGTAMRIGETTTAPMHVAGFSAPELLATTTISGKEDVYTLGAILYRGFAGQPIPEEGPELSSLSEILRIPASPQLLSTALAPVDARADMETFYQDLLAFKRRLLARPLALRVASGTSIGLNQTRSTNEDACGYLTWSSAWEGRVVYNALLCMIDGMGGMEAGEVAATSALRAVLRQASEYAVNRIAGSPGSDLDVGPDANPAATSEPLDLQALVQAAAEAAFTAAAGRQVGATITCVSVEDGTLRLGHVGDTRAYLLRHGTFTRLTRDHSLVAAMVASGVITAEEAENHPESNKVLRSLGGMRRLPPGYIDDLSIAHSQPTLALQDGDRLLLCSDGIWGSIDDDTLRDLLTQSNECEAVVRRAIDLALERGAPDNAAIIVAQCSVMPAS